MVRIGDVWDSTTDVLAGRAGLLVPIAALGFFLPGLVQAVIAAYGGTGPVVATLSLAVAIVVVVAAVWGQLATVAVASDPATTGVQARDAGVRRLGAGLLVTLVLVAAAIVACLPIGIALFASGYDWQAASAQAGSAGAMRVTPGAALFCFGYGLAIVAVAIWLAARLLLVNAAVLIEQRRIGAIGRSMQLTRGLTGRLVGVLILFVIVLLVATWAAQSVVFVVVRLLLGSPHIATATFAGAIAAAAVSAAFSTTVAVFGARLYAAIVDRAGVLK